jgi:hypothetical protein
MLFVFIKLKSRRTEAAYAGRQSVVGDEKITGKTYSSLQRANTEHGVITTVALYFLCHRIHLETTLYDTNRLRGETDRSA